jgi:hypothetical protein
MRRLASPGIVVYHQGMRGKTAAALGLCLIAGPSHGATWELLHRENFEKVSLPATAEWREEPYTEPGRYTDNGDYFREKNPAFKPPRAYRTHGTFGESGWLRYEAYTRNPDTELNALIAIDRDPSAPQKKALRLASPRHTDGIVVRPANPLPAEYRVCVRAGYVDYGTGHVESGTNGYEGSEKAEPWIDASSVNENGFYWLAILSEEPRPRNNVWIHHHRKVVIDSDNNSYPPEGSWSYIWDGKKFVRSGAHPVMMFALDKDHKNAVENYDRTGQPFISWAANQWNVEAETKQVRAADAYRDKTWYRVCIEKTREHYALFMSGDFEYGGETSYSAEIPRKRVFDPPGSPDYFMFGDPHANFYRGSAYIGSIELFRRSRSSKPRAKPSSTKKM